MVSRQLYLTLALMLASLLGLRAQQPSPKLGLEYTATLVYPEVLSPKPVDKKSPVILRIAKVEQVPEGFRHDIRYMGLRAGKQNLGLHLQRADGTPPVPVPEINVTLEALLPEVHDGKLAEIAVSPWRRWFGSYRNILIALGGSWALLLIPMLLWKKPKPPVVEVPVVPPPPTLADRIRPFLAPLTYQQIDGDGQAQLERLVHAYWREKLGISTETDVQTAAATLKASPEASHSLELLEGWLHYPPERRQNSTAQLLAEFSKY